MAIPLVQGVEVEYTPIEDMLVANTVCGARIEWQTDPAEPLWIPMAYNVLIRVSSGASIFVRTTDKKATVATAPDTL